MIVWLLRRNPCHYKLKLPPRQPRLSVLGVPTPQHLIPKYRQAWLQQKTTDASHQQKTRGPAETTYRCGVVAASTARGIADGMAAGLKTPLTVTHGLARGFHNAPRLYGDDTAREEEKVRGVVSGFKAASTGLGYGLYDGLTGFVAEPVKGARKEDGIGFLKGFGKGLGGVVLKLAAGACGVPGYAFMGMYREIQKLGKADLNL